MGMNWVMVRVVEDFDRDVGSITQLVATARMAPSDHTLDLGQNAHGLDAALKVVGQGQAVDAVYAEAVGEEVGEDPGFGYRPHLVSAEQVATVAADLARIDKRVFPEPDPDGYAPDPAIETNEQRRLVAEAVDRVGGGDPDNRGNMDHLEQLLRGLVRFYGEAAAAGQCILVFVR